MSLPVSVVSPHHDQPKAVNAELMLTCAEPTVESDKVTTVGSYFNFLPIVDQVLIACFRHFDAGAIPAEEI